MYVESTLQNPIGFFIDFIKNKINTDFKEWKEGKINSNPHGYDRKNDTFYSHSINSGTPDEENIFKPFPELYNEEIENELKKEFEISWNLILESKHNNVLTPNRFEGYVKDKVLIPLYDLQSSYEELFEKLPILKNFEKSIKKKIIRFCPEIAQKLKISYVKIPENSTFNSKFQEIFEFMKTAKYKKVEILSDYSYELLFIGLEQIYSTGKLDIEGKVIFNGIKPNAIGNYLYIFNEEFPIEDKRLEYKVLATYLPNLIEGFTSSKSNTFTTKPNAQLSQIHMQYMSPEMISKFIKYGMFVD